MIKCNIEHQCGKGKDICCSQCEEKSSCDNSCMNHPAKCKLARGSELERMKRR
jgi:hypothetical protein